MDGDFTMPKSKPKTSNAPRTRPLTHVDRRGQVRMVDIGGKPVVHRLAVAEGFLLAAPETIDRIMAGDLPKGEAIAAARIAGILAAKKCDQLIPLCHTLPLDSVSVQFERAAVDRLRIVATASISAKTGVEMEALVAVTISALALYDMAKAIDKSMSIDAIRVVQKHKSSKR
jgi:cyclic pyranopterin monophosphate synthase